jgi:hypothetical protein
VTLPSPKMTRALQTVKVLIKKRVVFRADVQLFICNNYHKIRIQGKNFLTRFIFKTKFIQSNTLWKSLSIASTPKS